MPNKNLNPVLVLVLFLSVIFNTFAETPLLEDASDLPAAQSSTGQIIEPAASRPTAAQATDSQPIVVKPADFPAVIPAENLSPQISTDSAVFVHKVKGKMNSVYKSLFTKLENNGYYVIFEPNIGRNLAHFSKRWGKDYNTNKLDSIRSMVFCNGWYANKISNEDPVMLALCPLHVTLIHKDEFTSILFVRPGRVSQGSSANSTALELEQDVIRIIKESVL